MSRDTTERKLAHADLNALIWAVLGAYWISTIPGTSDLFVAVSFFVLELSAEAINAAKVWIAK